MLCYLCFIIIFYFLLHIYTPLLCYTAYRWDRFTYCDKQQLVLKHATYSKTVSWLMLGTYIRVSGSSKVTTGKSGSKLSETATWLWSHLICRSVSSKRYRWKTATNVPIGNNASVNNMQSVLMFRWLLLLLSEFLCCSHRHCSLPLCPKKVQTAEILTRHAIRTFTWWQTKRG